MRTIFHVSDYRMTYAEYAYCPQILTPSGSHSGDVIFWVYSGA